MHQIIMNIIFANIDDLDDIKRAYEKEIAEKDRKIDLLLTANKQITYSTKNREYNKPKLYKEYFEVFKSCYGCFSNRFDSKGKCYIYHANKVIRLKDNSNYDKLPSKDVK
ncbi:hypothetical protein [Spiroplasma endosymbiont of Polydrusus formosus]|uniref:hypothetical protein n=1 Tax=Spiroplasma endosymbiont of Polydrusus formosus TaxID=3139326 RepID=UPI0035B4FC88